MCALYIYALTNGKRWKHWLHSRKLYCELICYVFGMCVCVLSLFRAIFLYFFSPLHPNALCVCVYFDCQCLFFFPVHCTYIQCSSLFYDTLLNQKKIEGERNRKLRYQLNVLNYKWYFLRARSYSCQILSMMLNDASYIHIHLLTICKINYANEKNSNFEI